MNQDILDDALKSLIAPTQTLENLDKAYYLIKAGANPNSVRNYMTILWPVVETGDTDLLASFVAVGCDVNCKPNPESYFKAIDKAIGMKNCDMVNWFLDHGINANEKIGHVTRFQFLLSNGYHDAVIQKMFLSFIEHGADLLIKNQSGKTILEQTKTWSRDYVEENNVFLNLIREETERQKHHLNMYLRACMKVPTTERDFDIAYSLIEKGAAPNIMEINICNILHYVAMYGTLEQLEKFVKVGCDINALNCSDQKPIDFAIRYSKADQVDWYLSNGINIDEKYADKFKRIHFACSLSSLITNDSDLEKHIEVIKVLLKHGADLHERDDSECKYKRIPIECAIAVYGNPKFIDFLKKEMEKARVMQTENLNQTLKSLIELPLEGSEAFECIEKGANANTRAQSHHNQTILWRVIEKNDVGLLAKFVEKGCDIHLKDNEGNKIIDYAIIKRLPKIVDWLLSNGINKDEIMGHCKRIHYVCSDKFSIEDLDKENLLDIIRVFIDHGSNINEPDEVYQKTPRDWAMNFNRDPENPLIMYLTYMMEEQSKKDLIKPEIKQEIKEEIKEEIIVKNEKPELSEDETKLTDLNWKIQTAEDHLSEVRAEVEKYKRKLKELHEFLGKFDQEKKSS